jgi:hypothetical protein
MLPRQHALIALLVAAYLVHYVIQFLRGGGIAVASRVKPAATINGNKQVLNLNTTEFGTGVL